MLHSNHDVLLKYFEVGAVLLLFVILRTLPQLVVIQSYARRSSELTTNYLTSDFRRVQARISNVPFCNK